MKFVERTVYSHQTDRDVKLWLPGETPYLSTEPYTEIRVGSRRRMASTALMDLMISYHCEPKRRTQLGQDCVVFALSWQDGDVYGDTKFNQPGGKTAYGTSDFRKRSHDSPMDLLPHDVGQMVISVDGTVDDPEILSRNPHVMVRATTHDEDEPLYASKLGQSGPVVLSTLDRITEMYPAKTRGFARDIRVRDFTAADAAEMAARR